MSDNELYSFAFRALLTEEALDRAGRPSKGSRLGLDTSEIERLASISVLNDDLVLDARKMSVVYVAIASFENSVRELLSRTLAENVGEDWWEICVSERIKKSSRDRMGAEEKVRWHVQRGENPIYYTMLPNLINIIAQNYDPHFIPYINDIEWAKAIFETLERSRNVIMHSGMLSERDVARVGISIRDWVSQVSI